MLIQKGYYASKQIIQKSTVNKFNKTYFRKNRRGLGFDKPNNKKGGPTYQKVSKDSFGHYGYTGTMVWFDPKEDLVFVFLSNRTFPKNNNNFKKNNIRIKIQTIIYNSIID